jgi:hypothetical protein
MDCLDKEPERTNKNKKKQQKYMWPLKGLLFRNREMGEIVALNEPMGSIGKSGVMEQGNNVPWGGQRQNTIRG